MEGMLAYSTSVFGEASAKRLVGELVQLLGSAAAAPQAPAATLELLPPAERQLVLSTFADAQGDAPPQVCVVRSLTALPPKLADRLGGVPAGRQQTARQLPLAASYCSADPQPLL